MRASARNSRSRGDLQVFLMAPRRYAHTQSFRDRERALLLIWPNGVHARLLWQMQIRRPKCVEQIFVFKYFEATGFQVLLNRLGIRFCLRGNSIVAGNA